MGCCWAENGSKITADLIKQEIYRQRVGLSGGFTDNRQHRRSPTVSYRTCDNFAAKSSAIFF